MPVPRTSHSLSIVLASLALAAAAPAQAEGTALRHGTARLATGVTLEYVETGPADGRPVLFLHGYTDSWRSFAGVLERLPAGVRGLAPSQRGHGGSERPACCYGVPDLVADAVALLDARGIERASVVGHSMGSFVARRLAAEHPERVDRLVLVGAGPRVGVPPVIDFHAAVAGLADPIPRQLVHEFQAGTVHRPLPDEMLAVFVDESLRVPARVWRQMLDGLLEDDRRPLSLSDVAAPTLVLGGERDAFWPPAELAALHAALPASTLALWPDSGHSPHWEAPERFVAELAAFLAAPPPTAPAAPREAAD
jgi:non-heme chloroperoxidase